MSSTVSQSQSQAQTDCDADDLVRKTYRPHAVIGGAESKSLLCETLDANNLALAVLHVAPF